MTDLRAYNETVKAAVARERQSDPNWSWNIKAVNKNVVKIGWGYLDFLGETDSFFTVEISEEDDSDMVAVVGTIPNGCQKIAFIGPKHWDDAETIEDGIKLVIHAMANSAHNTY